MACQFVDKSVLYMFQKNGTSKEIKSLEIPVFYTWQVFFRSYYPWVFGILFRTEKRLLQNNTWDTSVRTAKYCASYFPQVVGCIPHRKTFPSKISLEIPMFTWQDLLHLFPQVFEPYSVQKKFFSKNNFYVIYYVMKIWSYFPKVVDCIQHRKLFLWDITLGTNAYVTGEVLFSTDIWTIICTEKLPPPSYSLEIPMFYHVTKYFASYFSPHATQKKKLPTTGHIGKNSNTQSQCQTVQVLTAGRCLIANPTKWNKLLYKLSVYSKFILVILHIIRSRYTPFHKIIPYSMHCTDNKPTQEPRMQHDYLLYTSA